jgi:hypothetical protein
VTLAAIATTLTGQHGWPTPIGNLDWAARVRTILLASRQGMDMLQHPRGTDLGSCKPRTTRWLLFFRAVSGTRAKSGAIGSGMRPSGWVSRTPRVEDARVKEQHQRAGSAVSFLVGRVGMGGKDQNPAGSSSTSCSRVLREGCKMLRHQGRIT